MIADVRQMLDATVVMLLGIARDTQSDSLRHLLLGGGENEAGARKRELGGLEDLRHFIERESASAQDETTEFALRMQEDREALGSSKLFGACGKRALNFTEHERGVCVCVCVWCQKHGICAPHSNANTSSCWGFFWGRNLSFTNSGTAVIGSMARGTQRLNCSMRGSMVVGPRIPAPAFLEPR